MATRGRRRTQLANSAQGAGRPRITTPSQNRKKGRGWHTNRGSWRAILVTHLAISCRDPNRFGATVWGNGLGQRLDTTFLRARAGAVLELRHEEGADQNHNPVRGSRQGHRRFFERTSTLTQGWIQPRDKPVSGFDRLPPSVYKASTFLSVEDEVAALPW